MNRSGLLLLSRWLLPLLAACTAEKLDDRIPPCPVGEHCSTSTPNGLRFTGEEITGVFESNIDGPPATAIGGTQAVVLDVLQSDRGSHPMDLPYVADDDGAQGIGVEHVAGNVVTVRGVGIGSNFLRVLDPDRALYDRKRLAAAAIAAITLTPTSSTLTIPAGASLAWTTDQTAGAGIGVALSAASSERLVDDSMQLELEGGERIEWDQIRLPNAAVGTYSLAVTAGDLPRISLPIVYVDHADAVSPIQAPATVAPDTFFEVCFAPTAAGRFIVGLKWTFDVNDDPAMVSESNCVRGMPVHNATAVTIRASAGGQSTTLTIPVS